MSEPEKPKSQVIPVNTIDAAGTGEFKVTGYSATLTLTVNKASELPAALARNDVQEVIYTEQGQLHKDLIKYAFWQNATDKCFGIAKIVANYRAKKITREIRFDAKWKLIRKVSEFSGSIKFSRTLKGEKED
jgi:hypothetical protein